jgi:hypothetical protein
MCIIESTKPVYAASTSTHNAQCVWNGQTYHASSRGSIVASMARTLIKAGHPDAPWQLTRDGEVVLMGGSLHRVAGLTITEDDTHGLRVQKFRRRAEEAIAA